MINSIVLIATVVILYYSRDTMINSIVLIATVVILVAQCLLSKKYTPIIGFATSTALNVIIVITLCVIQVATYDNINNSAPIRTFLIPIIVYGVLLEVVNYIIYRVIRKK